MTPNSTDTRPHVAIIGAGFAGLWASQQLANKAVRVTLFDRNNYHTFQPLLYQVAAAEIEPEQIAYPVRGILRNMPNVTFALADVSRIDPDSQTIIANGTAVQYDYLILATGSITQFFNTPGAAEHAFSLKTMDEGVWLRNHILACFEQAVHVDAQARRRLLTFVVVGGGPTGVEFAGALSELIYGPIYKDFPELNIDDVSIVLVEAMDKLLGAMPPKLSQYAAEQISRMKISTHLQTRVTAVTENEVFFADGSRIPTNTVVWVAGVGGEPLASQSALPILPNGRVPVSPTLQIPPYDNLYATGDIAAFQTEDGHNLPMVAQVAIQQGSLAAQNILHQIEGRPLQPFRYHDKGSMATIGRNRAVVDLNGRAFTGFFAWITWLFVHLLYLIGFRNRLIVIFTWAWRYITFEHMVRLILPTRRIQWPANHKPENPTPPPP